MKTHLDNITLNEEALNDVSGGGLKSAIALGSSGAILGGGSGAIAAGPVGAVVCGGVGGIVGFVGGLFVSDDAPASRSPRRRSIIR